MKTITKKEHFPAGPHFAIVEWVDHYEHGLYPYDNSVKYTYVNYIVCENQQEWSAEVTRRTLDKTCTQPWIPIHGNAPANIKVNIEVK